MEHLFPGGVLVIPAHLNNELRVDLSRGIQLLKFPAARLLRVTARPKGFDSTFPATAVQRSGYPSDVASMTTPAACMQGRPLRPDQLLDS